MHNMKNKKKKEKYMARQSARLTTSGLLKKMFAEFGWDMEECVKDRCYHMSLKEDNGDILKIFVDTDNDFSFIRIMTFNWRVVKMTDVEEVARVQAAICRFNIISRAKVYYKVEGDNMHLSTMLHCSFCEEMPDIKYYFLAQMDTVLDAYEFIFPSDGEKDLPWHGIPLYPQAKLSKDIVIGALKELNCKPEVEIGEENFYSIKFDYQTESFEIITRSTGRFVKLLGPCLYSFDVADIEKLSVVKNIVNDLNWTLPTTLSYGINEDRWEVSSHAILACIEGIDFTQSLYLMLFGYFHSRNMFHKMLAESSAR